MASESLIPELAENEMEEQSPSFVASDGRELYEHFRFVADKGQQLLRIDKFLTERLERTSRNRVQQAADAERMLREGFTMDDMLAQMQQIRKMGGLQKIASMIPGMDRAMAQQPGANLDDSQLTRIEAIIQSMTPEERRNEGILNGSRKKRIAAGSGTSVQEINKLLKQFEQTKKMMKQFSGMAKKGKKGKGFPGFPGFPGM